MFTIFNRRELLITFDIQRQAEVRRLLSQHKIPYFAKAFNSAGTLGFGSSRARTGSFGIQPEYQYEYKIYVHKSDFDLAAVIISGHFKR